MSGARMIRWVLIANLIAIGVIAIWLRIFSLESIPLHNIDESNIGLQGLKLLRGERFSWTTTSGNLVDPFLVVLQAPLQALLGPSLLALRIPAALVGVAIVALLWLLFRDVLGQRQAAIAAILAATMPVAIIFSRHALEYGQTPLIGVIAAWAAWRGRPLSAFLALIVGLLIHPTNIFLVPLLLPLLLERWLLAKPFSNRDRIIRGLIIGLALVALIIPFSLWARRNPNVLDHAEESRNPVRLATGLGRFLFARLVIEGQPLVHFDLAIAIIATALTVPGLVSVIARRKWDRMAMALGLLLGLIAFDMKAGAEVLDGPAYRYGAVFIIPIALFVAVMIDETAQCIPRRRATSNPAWSWAITVAIGWVGLTSAWQHQFRLYMSDGADAAMKLRSRDGFRLALHYIERDIRNHPGPGKTVILAQDQYLNALQFEYLAHDNKTIEVQPLIGLADIDRRKHDEQAFEPQKWLIRHTLETGGYAVQLDGSDPMRGGGLIAATVAAHYPPARVKAYRTPAWGGQSLTVFRLIDRETAARPTEPARR